MSLCSNLANVTLPKGISVRFVTQVSLHQSVSLPRPAVERAKTTTGKPIFPGTADSATNALLLRLKNLDLFWDRHHADLITVHEAWREVFFSNVERHQEMWLKVKIETTQQLFVSWGTKLQFPPTTKQNGSVNLEIAVHGSVVINFLRSTRRQQNGRCNLLITRQKDNHRSSCVFSGRWQRQNNNRTSTQNQLRYYLDLVKVPLAFLLVPSLLEAANQRAGLVVNGLWNHHWGVGGGIIRAFP